jgi:uncharacterized protein (TIGR02646 family)
MIRINKGTMPDNIIAFAVKNVKALDGSLVTRAARELELAVKFFTDPNNYEGEFRRTKKGFEFKVYSDSQLAAALGAIFETKCAYCESDFGHVTSKHVEHFRPKAEIIIEGQPRRRGYFWLACDWDNLLVSCPDCNVGREHKVFGQEEPVKLGKGNQFPLADEKKRARNQAPIEKEEPVRLLLNPCIDDPELHLTYDEKGLVYPRKDANDNLSPQGEASISVYGLQRWKLVDRRQNALKDLMEKVDDLMTLVGDYNDLDDLRDPPERFAKKLEQIRKVRQRVEELFSPRSEYQGILRDWIRVGSERGDFDLLLQFEIDLTELIKKT